MNINVASIANAKVIWLYFHLNTSRIVANSGTGLKQLCNINKLEAIVLKSFNDIKSLNFLLLFWVFVGGGSVAVAVGVSAR